MKLSILCLIPGSLGLASVLRPDAIGSRSILPLEEQKEPPSCSAARALLSSRLSARVSGDGWDKKPPFVQAIEDWFRSSSPGSGSWPDDAASPINPGDYGHAKGVPQWGGQEPPINDEDFCTAVRAMAWIARNIIPDTEQIRPETCDGAVAGVCKQRGEAVIVLRMMMSWQKLLAGLKRQLYWTPELTSQMHCALCYIEYSIESGNWLRSLRKQAAYFKRDDEFRNIMFKRLDELHEAHHDVAKLLHDRRSASLINTRIPENDRSGLADTLHKLHGKTPGDSLREWIQEGDPAYPRVRGGLFKRAKNAWAYQKEKEDRKRAVSADESADESAEPDRGGLVKRDTPTKTDSLLEARRASGNWRFGGPWYFNGSWLNGSMAAAKFNVTPNLTVVSIPTSNPWNTPMPTDEGGGAGQKYEDHKEKEEEEVNLLDGKCHIRECGFRERLVCAFMGWDYCVCGPGCTQKDAHLLFDGPDDEDED